jgi:hypothetical protein
MSEHLSKIQLARYTGRTLNADELLDVDRHLASCDACYARLPGGVNVSAPTFESVEEPFHLDYEEHLKPFVDGQLDEIDREIVESHVALCSTCAADLEDLHEFSKQPVHIEAGAVSPALWKQWLPSRLAASPFAVAFVVIVFILGLTVAVLMWTMRPGSGPVQQAARTSPPVTDSPPVFGYDSGRNSAREETVTNYAAKPPAQPVKKPIKPKTRAADSLLALNDGGRQVTLNRQGQMVGLEELPADLRQTVAHVLTTRRFDASPGLVDLAETTRRRMRGEDEQADTVQVLAPRGVVVQSDRPTFRWRALEGAVDYIVRIYDSKLRDIESSGPLAGTEWKVERPLERGVTYSWQIRATKDGKTVVSPKPPAPEARFRVLDEESAAALENAKRLHSSSHLAMGVLYWKHGLIDEAEREFQALVTANPDSPVAAQLLESLR